MECAMWDDSMDAYATMSSPEPQTGYPAMAHGGHADEPMPPLGPQTGYPASPASPLLCSDYSDASKLESSDNRDEEQQELETQSLKYGTEITDEEWTHFIQENPHCRNCPTLRDRRQSDVSIFMVPKFLKDTKKEAYVPQRVSLGPYHHRSPELELHSMGHRKGIAVPRMMKRFNANKKLRVDPNDMDFANRAKEEILKVEKEIRNSYEEYIDCNRETLARMLTLDGCFLIEVLRTRAGDKLSRAQAGKYYDPVFGEKKLDYAAQDVWSDLLILENQIPFIVLLKLLQLELNRDVGDRKNREKLFDLAKGISRFLIPFDSTNLDIDEQRSCDHHHLLDFLHAAIASPPSSSQCNRVDQGESSISIDCCSRQCILKLQRKSKARNNTERIPHAVELRNAGIKFSPLQGGCIKQIKFDENSATIFLPRVSITDPTERIFRNLIAYEMCKPSFINYVTCYVALMDDLIDSEPDVALLRRMGVMSNWLGSDKEVVDLFNGLCKEVNVHSKDVFDNLTEKVNAPDWTACAGSFFIAVESFSFDGRNCHTFAHRGANDLHNYKVDPPLPSLLPSKKISSVNDVYSAVIWMMLPHSWFK